MASADLIICGAGPAGSALALALAPFMKVLLLERHASAPQGERIGESLPGAAQPLLQRLGVWDAFLQGGHKPRGPAIAAWDLDTPVWRDSIRDPAGPGWHLDRCQFEQMLRHQAQAAGAKLVSSGPVKLSRKAGLWQVSCHGHRYSAPRLVDASGRAGALCRQLGLRKSHADPLLCLYSFLPCPPAPDGSMRLQADEQGWWYTVALPQGKRILAYHLDRDNPHRQLLKDPDMLLRWARRHPLLAEVLAGLDPAAVASHPAGTALLNPAHLARAGDGFYAIGDALFSFDPLSSQGLFHALASAASAAKAITTDTPQGAATFRQEMQAVAQHYLRHWLGCYQGPRRFEQHSFWQRRQDPMGLAAAFT
ncbi:NAD(P)/FAD-dependent oxidoreductase [Gallaecimonas xiamenensis]|uniref:Uncharacterized protein n=1 Tax=Gallaecimonas xiamenensis 3-C-1 TaxID=745411 RepID=K2JCZ2_9GAMM|nr:tryptophan 7-halogenase [Gallaecimonas xiamenensis]EKE68484.1 hypothetical protein B3C1_16772 [Gallaecimonas xiamenensis 3-C-1]